MTITNQTNPVGTQYESDKSLIRVPRKGNPFVVENTFIITHLIIITIYERGITTGTVICKSVASCHIDLF